MERFRIQILFYLRKNRKTVSGEYPIYLRVSINGTQSAISTGRTIRTRFWKAKKSVVRDGDENAESINEHLKSLRNKGYQSYTDFEKQGSIPTAKEVLDLMAGKNENIHTLLSAYQYHNKQMALKTGKGIAPGSFKNH
jgi:hypothetical protein